MSDGRPARRSRRPRRRRARGAGLLRVPRRRSRRTARASSRTRPPCSRPVQSPCMSSPAIPTNLKVTLPADLASGGAGARAPMSAALGFGHDSHPFGPGAPLASAASRSPARRGSTATPTATSRSTPSPTRCSARPASATSAACSRPTPRRRAGSRARELARARSSPARGGRLAAGLGRRDDRRGPAPAGRPARRDARPRSRRCSGSTGRRSTSRRRRATSPATRAPAASISARAVATLGPPDDASGCGTRSAARPAARAARARARPRLQLRPDGLRPGPHRQLPVVPVRRPAGPLPALPRPAR